MILSEELGQVRDAVRTFVSEQITPHAARWDRESIFPAQALKGLAELGCYGVAVPEQWGGAGLDYLALALVIEEIAAGDGGTSTVISVTNCPVNAILMRYGNEAQQKKWLTLLAQGEMLGAFCLTEPHVGSDASALRTTAARGLWTLVKTMLGPQKTSSSSVTASYTDTWFWILTLRPMTTSLPTNTPWPREQPSPMRAPAQTCAKCHTRVPAPICAHSSTMALGWAQKGAGS